MKKLLFTVFVCLIANVSYAQQIFLDDSYVTWNRSSLPYFYKTKKIPSYPSPDSMFVPSYEEDIEPLKIEIYEDHRALWEAKKKWNEADKEARARLAKEKELNDLKRFKKLRSMSIKQRKNYRNIKVIENYMGKNWTNYYFNSSHYQP